MASATSTSRRLWVLVPLGLAAVATLLVVVLAGDGTPDGQVTVSIGDNWYEPEQLTVAPGTEIVFENTGRDVHNAIHVDGAWRTRDVIEPGESDTITIDEPGEYVFYCSFHAPPDASGGQVGTIVVSEDAADAGERVDVAQPTPGDVEPVEPTGVVRRVPQDHPTIQNGVDAAEPGDLVLVDEGVYREQVAVATEQIVLRGVDRNTVIIDGEFQRDMGVIVTADGVAIENMTARNTNANGFYWTGVNGYRGSYLTAVNNAVYGIYAFDSVDGVFEHSYASGSADAGFYKGQCYDCHGIINEVTAEQNGVGYSGTNSSNVHILNSVWRGNGAGIVPNTLDSQRYPPSRDNVIAGNLVEDSGHRSTPVVGAVWGARGVGIILAAGQHHEVRDNVVRNSTRYGFAATPNLSDRFWQSGGNEVRGNDVSGSGWADLAVVAPSREGGDCFADNVAGRTLPTFVETARPCAGPAVPSLGSFRHLWAMIGHVADFPGRTMPEEMLDELPEQPLKDQLPGGVDAPVRPAVNVFATYDAVDVETVGLPEVDEAETDDRAFMLAGLPLAGYSGWQWYFTFVGWVLPVLGLLGLAVVTILDVRRREDLTGTARGAWAAVLGLPALLMLLTWWPAAVVASLLASSVYLVAGRPAIRRRWLTLSGAAALVIVLPAVALGAGLVFSGIV